MGGIAHRQSKGLTEVEVAALLGVGTMTVRYRLAKGLLPAPNPTTGRWDKAAVLAAVATHPINRKAQAARLGKTKRGPGSVKKRRPATPCAHQATESGSKTEAIGPSGLVDPYSGDPEMSYRWAKAEREKLRLAKDEGSSIELAVVERRAFGFFRLIRNRLDGWVSRAAPIIAGKAKADEGTVWRAMSEEMRKLQTELGSLDLKRALTEREAEEAEDEEAEMAPAP